MRKHKYTFVPHNDWAVLITVAAVDGGVMSYGLIAWLFGMLDRHSSLSMLFMVIPMTVIMLIVMHFVMKKINARMDRLTTAIHRVSEGDLTTEISLTDAGDYEEVYQGFNAMVAELAKTKEEMTRFTNEFTHEFKTPITSINGFADYLCQTGKDIEDKERMEYLEVIRDQSRRLSDMASNALILSKAEACQVVTGREDFDLGEQIRKCAILFAREMEEKKITFSMPEDFSCPFNGNEEQLEQIWINLMKNAIKFTPEGGEIRILNQTVIKGSGKYIDVSVQDNGSGMDAETCRHIFSKYYQNDKMHFSRGNGIGLAIVKRITELYNGTISVTSEKGKGSTFTVELPLPQTDTERENT